MVYIELDGERWAGREGGRQGRRVGGREQGRWGKGGREQEEGGRGQGDVGEGGNKGREGGKENSRGVREEPMMLGRQRVSVEGGRVEGGRVDEGNERVRDGTRHGRREGGSERRRD